MQSNYSETVKIGFIATLSLMILGPIIAVVYVMYSFGYFLYHRHWDKGIKGLLFYPYVLVFYIANIAHNWIIATILFREFPREFITTDRLKRMKTSPDVWRRELADMLGGFLNTHDPNHY